MIRKAGISDLRGIYAILKKVGSTRKNPAEGFLMNDYSGEEEKHLSKYAADLEKLEYSYVFEEGDLVKAFLIAYHKEEWLRETPLWNEEVFWHPSFNMSQLDNFILINQTAMYPDLTGRGIGSKLYEALFRDVTNNGIYDVFAETLIAPVPNIASLNFRIKQKYQLAGVRYEKSEGTIYTTLVYHKGLGQF